MTRHDIQLPDLTGKRALVTGASDGMGLVIATRLAAAGAELILPVRNPRKGSAAVATITAVRNSISSGVMLESFHALFAMLERFQQTGLCCPQPQLF